ncbi:MAG: flagellar biosynthesis protein FlgA [Bacillota bacterium]|mgnify:FL=1|nr:MAG: flagellar biosynthesis protein FlgA [Bacillota bacterium]
MKRHMLVLMLAVAVATCGAAAFAQASDDGAEAPRVTVTTVPSPSAASTPHQPTVRVKDIARFEGVRDNQLFGMGLVIGLEGTGDGRGSQANVQMVANMLERFGITVDREALRLRNVAAVMVTADLPAFVRPGDRIDVTVSSFGDARSLQGGFLLQTPLEAADGRVYAVAQGPVSIGGFNVRAGGSEVQRNHTAVGIVPGGAIVERSVPAEVLQGDRLTLILHEPDFTTAARVAEAINRVFTPDTARALDRSAIEVRVPSIFMSQPVEFIALVEEIEVTPDAPARVVINERTGTIVMGHRARIATVAVAHGGLTVRVETEPQFGFLPPAEEGGAPTPVVVETTRIDVQEGGDVVLIQGGASVEDVVQALNAIGASPRDIIAVLQAIKAAGALYGELEVL